MEDIIIIIITIMIIIIIIIALNNVAVTRLWYALVGVCVGVYVCMCTH